MIKYIVGDIHDVIKDIEDNSIDFLYTNPPFGITEAKWDMPLDWTSLWLDIWRVMKPTGIVALHCSMPFTYTLIKSQTPKYHYCIKKSNKTGFLFCKKQPLRDIEEVLIYYKKAGTYNPQMIGDKIRKFKKQKNTKIGQGYYDNRVKASLTTSYKGYYPSTFLENKLNKRGGKSISDEIITYFIKTYSNEGDTILDMCCHNKVVGNLVKPLNRNYIGVDINEIKD
tara:strand:+ start:223 stop:897 length:675 start_codon:yes stop_codon:yes gene_type:complete